MGDVMKNKPDSAKLFTDIFDHGKNVQRLPIHEVCRHKPPISLIQILTSAYPHSLKVKDFNDGCLPIHFACRYGASEEVVRHMLHEYPESMNVQDKYGCLPVTMARRGCYKHKEDIVRIFETFKDLYAKMKKQNACRNMLNLHSAQVHCL